MNCEGRLFLLSRTTARIALLVLAGMPLKLQAQQSKCQLVCDQCGAKESHDARCLSAVADSILDSPALPLDNGNNAQIAENRADAFPLTTSTTSENLCILTTHLCDWPLGAARVSRSLYPVDVDREGQQPKTPSSAAVRNSAHQSLNQSVFYKNRLEFSLDAGWLPINIPFVFDVFLGDGYTRAPLDYTLVPIIFSLRWQMNDVGGPWILRGNWDLTTSGAVTVIPRGPETRYFAWIMGIRRNFVPRRGRFAPYFDGRLGLGGIDAKGPAGVLYAQGQDFTFTVNMGSGVRYAINSRYSISAGLNWMHISNLYLSEPQFSNYGINVYGPMLGIDVRLGKARRDGSR